MSHETPAPALEVVPPEEYSSFADGLRDFLPDSYHIEAMLRIHCAYRHLSFIDSVLYAPSDPFLRYKMALITPVCAVKEIRTISIYWSERDISEDALFHLLSSLPFSNWQMPCSMRQMPYHLQPTLHKVLYKLSGGMLNRVTPIPTVVLSLAPEDTPPIPRLPEGYYFKKLNGSHAEKALSCWSPSFSETKESMAFFLETLPSVGIFYRKQSKTENQENLGSISSEIHNQNVNSWRLNGENMRNNSGSNGVHMSQEIECGDQQKDELVSFVVLKHGSDTGMTFTDENHRRKGLGRAATLCLAHELHSRGIPVTVNVVVDYEMSINMHMQMGFKYLTHASFPVYCHESFDFESVTRLPIFIQTFSATPDQWLDICHLR